MPIVPKRTMARVDPCATLPTAKARARCRARFTPKGHSIPKDVASEAFAPKGFKVPPDVA